MVILVIIVKRRLLQQISQFESSLEIWDLKIVERIEERDQRVMHLVINAATPGPMNLVVSMAQTVFQSELVEARLIYDPSRVDWPRKDSMR